MNTSPIAMVVRLLAEGSSRRRMLGRGLAALVIPAAITRFDLHDTDGKKGGKRKQKKKVTVCRAGQTITVAKKAKKKHLRRGDTTGACPGSTPPPPGCAPACAGNTCGDDGCGGTCGQCESNQVCTNGRCCTPNCDGRTCGDDGCGGSCGTCQTNQTCTAGRCQTTCPSGQTPCFNVCIPATCQNQCNAPCRVLGSSCCGPLTCQSPLPGQLVCRPAS